MPNTGYFRTPTVNGSSVVFVCEDDLWTVPLGGGGAQRLTAGLGEVSRPALSRDGTLVAYTGREEHHHEVYVSPAAGGAAKRLTYLGMSSIVVGWSPDGSIIFRSDTGQPFNRVFALHAVDPNGGPSHPLPYGPANHIAYGPKGGIVLGRNTADPATWKRYRGGTAGRLWIDAKGRGTFKLLIDIESNLTCPMWIGQRIYFISDHEGIGNIYSCTPDGADLRRHTDHGEYYARAASSDGRSIVYQHAAELWTLDPKAGRAQRVEVDFAGPRTQRNRKFPEANHYLQSYGVHPKGHSLVLDVRGQVFSMPLWEGAPRGYGEQPGIRYRLGTWLADGDRIVLISDEGGEEALEIHRLADTKRKRFPQLDIGRAHELVASPKGSTVALANHRLELILVDLDTGTLKVLDRSRYGVISGIAWSPDGAWLAYSLRGTSQTMQIRLVEIATGRVHDVTRADFRDYGPVFDPEGKYLYFLSYRMFDPVYDAHFFDLGFPRGTKPYLVTLRKDLTSPFVPQPKGFGDQPEPKKDEKTTKSAKEDEAMRIDLDGLADRIVAFPVPEARYSQVRALKGKALFLSSPVEGSLGADPYGSEGPSGSLEVFDFGEQKHEVLFGGVSDFDLSLDGGTLLYRSGKRLRALKAGERPDAAFEKDPPGRKSGWIDLGRIRVSVEPGAEWAQMFREAWRLQRDNFWTEDMSGIDWPRIYQRYRPLVDKVATRSEFSDLVWEMQGELGTSHAYERGGDYRQPPYYAMGFLGADFTHDEKTGRWQIGRIVHGDPWDESQHSPLASVGVNVSEGDSVLAVNGRAVNSKVSPQELLVHQAGTNVELTVGDRAGRKPRRVIVKTLRDETPARYREWVEMNRDRVHEATGGRSGYVHIPNMMPAGYAEFHRYFLSELDREGLIVDVRTNGGGHVSQLILEKLARRRIGYDLQRWGQPEPYPADSVIGPMVCITNELAGSDGDIFTHCFKLMKLGPVVGKRTWGGVIGISPRHMLSDGSLTTQPEFSFWFTDVGWGVENYGSDPDYDVDIAPHDYVSGKDPQMEKALALITGALKANPPSLPDFGRRPSLKLPKLPKKK